MLTLVLALNSVLLLADLVLLVRMWRAQKKLRRELAANLEIMKRLQKDDLI